MTCENCKALRRQIDTLERDRDNLSARVYELEYKLPSSFTPPYLFHAEDREGGGEIAIKQFELAIGRGQGGTFYFGDMTIDDFEEMLYALRRARVS